MQAVEIESVESGAAVLWYRIIAAAKPIDEIQHVHVAPHPGGKSLEAAERLHCILVSAAANKTVHAKCIRPVRFDRNGSESLFFDQPFRDARALAIEIVCAVRSFTDEHEARFA